MKGSDFRVSALTRRDWMGGMATLASAALVARGEGNEGGGLRQSVAHWCFAKSQWAWSLEKTCSVAVDLGFRSVELLAPEQLVTLKPFGLECAMVSLNLSRGPGFAYGWNHPGNWPMLEEATRLSVDAAAAFGAPNVIAFVGMRRRDPGGAEGVEWSDEEGATQCAEGLKKVAGYAERKGVNICLEMLNSRDGSAPMLGHPGYQGDHVDYCVRILERVGSPRVKLLFDVYHAQIMDGDLVRRIRQHRTWIGHVHTAGVPGRGELGAGQEVSYPAVAAALREIGYTGFVGHEFLPTRDPVEGLREAMRACRI